MFRLKLFTTISFTFGLVMLLSWLFVLGPKPTNATKPVLTDYALRSLIYFGLTATALLCSAFGAWLILRKQKEEYATQHLEMMKSLVDGSLNDHAKLKQPRSTPNNLDESGKEFDS